VVSTSRDDELRSIEAAAGIGVDWVLGGTHPADGVSLLAGRPRKYCPFPGRVVGHPSILEGEIAEIADSARDITALDGVYGLDLLAYRHQTADVAELTGRLVTAASGPVIAAGSVASLAQVQTLGGGRGGGASRSAARSSTACCPAGRRWPARSARFFRATGALV